MADIEAMLLRLVGYDAKACYDGHTALVVACEFHPCICLLDLNMPEMEGDILARKLREQAEGRLKLVAVTAMSNEKSIVRTTVAGFDKHLVKPVKPSLLIETVGHLAHDC